MAAPAGNNWRRVEELFYTALELAPEERANFLDRSCGNDAALRSEVQSLLDSSGKTLGFLQEPVEKAYQYLKDAPEDITTGRPIGAYRLLRVLGEGGTGRVYLAERADDLYKQQVAIKLMHAGFCHTQRMLLRFGAERQILANLNHPNIARLLDGGLDDGLPYLVMEYVDGVPLDAYCRNHRLGIEARLRLFITVCEAVEYAHKNLVVHRDIKPGNILVTNDGVPKLLDFGIAKLLDPEGSEPAVTRATERMMTPEYASPEQVRGDRVTTSTDVYALGVLLYELLCGKRPFQLGDISPMEAIRTICERQPTAPSVAGKENANLAPPDFSKNLDGDLDNIVLMAMRKEPARRYVSVGQFADDVKAHLDGYPVQARTDTWGYRSGKFVRRHKAGVTAAVVIAVALVGFSIGMGILARRAQRERNAAEREAQFLSSIFQSTTPNQARGKLVTGRDLLDEGAKRVDIEFAGEPQLQATLLHNIGLSYRLLGVYDKAELLTQRAYELRRQILGESNLDTVASLDGLATVYRLESQFKKAEPLFRQALAVREAKLGPNDLLVAESLDNLGECVYLEEKDEEAELLLRRALSLQLGRDENASTTSDNYLALALERKGQFREASQLLRNALDINGRLEGTDSPNYAISLHNLAGALIDSGDLTSAEAMDLQALALRRKLSGPGNPDLTYPLNNLGFIYLARGDWAAAEPMLKENLEIQRSVSPKSPRVAGALNNWARMQQQRGDYREAQNSFQQALAMVRETSGPSTWNVAKITANLGLCLLDEGNAAEAERDEREAIAMQEKLGGSESPDLANSLANLALTRWVQQDPAGAEPLLRQALDIRKKELSAEHPTTIATEVRLGEALIDQGRTADAEPILREAVRLIHAVPFALVPWQTAEAEIALGDCLAFEGHGAEATPLLRDAESRLKGYPQATLRSEILRRVAKAQTALKHGGSK
jgi:serine/threonine-protein kinase